jgi:hypothetical protein
MTSQQGSEYERELERMAEWIVTHPPDVSPEYVGSMLADAEAYIEPLLRGEERAKALRERAEARRWLRDQAETRGYKVGHAKMGSPELAVWIRDFLKARPSSAFSASDVQAAVVKADHPAPTVSEIEVELDAMYRRGIVTKPLPSKYQYVPGWEQRIQYQLGHRGPGAITASQREYEKPMPKPVYSITTKGFDVAAILAVFWKKLKTTSPTELELTTDDILREVEMDPVRKQGARGLLQQMVIDDILDKSPY